MENGGKVRYVCTKERETGGKGRKGEKEGGREGGKEGRREETISSSAKCL